MRILFDQGTPVPLKRHLGHHDVETAATRGWGRLENGELLQAAEDAGFEVFVSTDQNLKYQQNLKQRSIGLVILLTTSWPKIEDRVEAVVIAIDKLPKGGYVEVAA